MNLLDLTDESRLADSLEAHHAERGAGPLDTERKRACLMLLQQSGSEPGWNGPPDAVRLLISESNVPEFRFCRIWIERSDPNSDLPALINRGLWPPLRFLAYRAIASFGHRTTLANLLASFPSSDLPEMDAWLDASRVADAPPLDPPSAGGDWAGLLRAELGLDSSESVLRELATAVPSETGFAAVASRHQISRAAAALARLSLARGASEGALPSTRNIPDWEQSYLRGLGCWQRKELDLAIERLRDALVQNPHQTCVRLALSTVVARRSPEEALELSVHEEPTRDLLIHRAALLARVGRYFEATEELARQGPWECVRCSWPEGQAALRRQEQFLAAALTEHNGHWNEAEHLWRQACPPDSDRSLAEARHFFIAAVQLRNAGSAWSRDIARRKVDRAVATGSNRPLVNDASFFRAAAWGEIDPPRALPDLLALWRRRSWQESELANGGGRVLCVADALLRLGRAGEALDLYRLLPGEAERTAIAAACLGSKPDEGTDAPNPWAKLFAGLAQLAPANVAGADASWSTARECGLNEDFCLALEALGAALGGGRRITVAELAALGLSPIGAATVWLAVGEAPESERAGAYFAAAGERWIESCPTDPERLARVLADRWCGDGNWEQAFLLAERLDRCAAPWAAELAELIRVRRALERAVRGEFDAAEEALGRLSNGTVC